ncbi:polynucleotidyl transferase ribonuclease H fold, partial [Trifolium medium]|nr:polynucleotidyl transferase ribonuclease H fold [Trifolium medium]
VGHNAFQMWQSWFDTHTARAQFQQMHEEQHSPSWSKPYEGWLKINMDADFFENQGITTTACCVRNSHGEFQGAQTRKYNSRIPILEGEGVAMLD